LHAGRVFVCLTATFIAMLMTVVVYGVIRYGHLAEMIPDQNLSSPSGALYWYSAYGGFLEITTVLLAFLLGICAALFGIVKGSFLRGLAFLAVFTGLTFLAFSLLPHYYYPGGELSAGLYWLTHGFYDFCGAWLLVTIVGFVIRRKTADKGARKHERWSHR